MMKKIIRLPLDELKDRFIYEPETGRIFQKRVNKHGVVLGVFETALKPSRKKYKTVSLRNKTYFAHRVAYALYHNLASFGIIDHIDGNPGNNKISNLREVSNGYNIYLAKKNKTKGVYYYKKTGFWQAYINFNGKRIYLGIYKKKEDAIKKRIDAELYYYNNSKSSISS